MKAISDQDHEHAQQVWNRIKPGHNKITLEHYHDVYPKTDVLLLADVFEVFQQDLSGWIQHIFTSHQAWHSRPY